MCSDVSVLRSADCWTEHKLLRGQLRISLYVRKSRSVVRKKFAVGTLKDEKVRESFNKKVCEYIKSIWQSAASGAEKWEVIRDGLTDTGQSVLGWENRRQPDWFKESASVLERCIEKRNMLFRRWLRSGRSSDRQKYVAQRKTVAGAVKRAKNDWLQQKAKVVEAGMMSGRSGGGNHM